MRQAHKISIVFVIAAIFVVLSGVLAFFILEQDPSPLPAAGWENNADDFTNPLNPSPAEDPLPDETESADSKDDESAVPSPKPFLVDASLGEEMFEVMESESLEIAPGLVHQHFKLKGVGRLENLLQALDILAVDLSRPEFSVEIVSPGEHVLGKRTVPNIALEANDEKRRAVAAFNLDFFDMSNGMPRGLQITDGEIITGIKHLLSLLAVKPDGTIMLGQGTVMEAVLETDSGDKLEIHGINKMRNDSFTNHAFIMTDRFHASTLSSGDGIEAVIAPDQEGIVLRAGEEISGKIEAIYETANNEIPPGKFILTASGSRADWIKQHLRTGDDVKLKVTFQNENLHEAPFVYAGGSHSLAKALIVDEEIPVWIKNVRTSANTDRHPRTIAASRGNYFYVMTFDGRRKGHADGISLQEAAEYLMLLGMEQAINADGGGSTTFAAVKPGEQSFSILNRPSDGTLREVANALVIMSANE